MQFYKVPTRTLGDWGLILGLLPHGSCPWCRDPCHLPLTYLHRFATLASVTSANLAQFTHAHS